MPVPFIHLLDQHRSIRKEVLRSLTDIGDNQHFVLGKYGRELEEKIAKHTGVSQAIGLASGSDALYLALLALGIGEGDEVITTPFTFFASASCISRTGAKPVFCDIERDTYNIDAKKIRPLITRRTKAILPVHLFGLPCDMDAILDIAKKHKLAVVEDAAQSFGATFKGSRTGSLGDAGCFSFYPTKNLGGAGDGGMLVTRSKELADKVRLLRNHGSPTKYVHTLIGINSRLDELQAAWLLPKLKRIDGWNAKRAKIAARYDKAFKDLPVQTPWIPKGRVSNYHLYSIQILERDALSRHLTQLGIGNGVYYPLPLHLQPCYKSLGYKKGDLPVSESVCAEVLSLPMFAELASKDVETVIRAVRSFFKK